jgi:phosphatidylinositol-3-phosphatase
MRRISALAVLACALWAATASTASAAPPAVRHIFLILLENKTYNKTFGPSPGSPYLAKTLPSQGALLDRFYGIAHLSLPNYIALASGQPPNGDTQSESLGPTHQTRGDSFPGQGVAA